MENQLNSEPLKQKINLDFNDLDFASSDPVDIELTLRYDYAILQF